MISFSSLLICETLVVSVESPKDGEACSEAVRILTNRFLCPGAQISEFDAQLACDRIAEAKRPGQVFLPVVLLHSIQGGLPAIAVAKTRCCPETGAKGVNEVSLECVKWILLQLVSIEKIIVIRVK